MKGWRRTKGYTLTEAIVVVGLIAALLAIAIPAFYRTLQANRVQTAARTMATNLRFVRMAAVKQKINYTVTVLDDSEPSNPNTYTVQYDPTRSGALTDYDRIDTNIPDGVIIDSTSLNSVSFNGRGGANPSGTILLIGKDSTRYQITITISGSVTMDRV